MIAETFLERTIRDQFLEVSVLRTAIRVLHHGGPKNLGTRGSDLLKEIVGNKEQARLTSISAASPPLP